MWTQLLRPMGVDMFCTGKKFLVFNLVNRNLKIKYRRSFFGFFWTVISPLSMAMVFYFVFKVIMNVKLEHYLAFILSGMIPWNFFSQTILEGMESLVMNLALISKVPIPLQVFPFVGSLTNLTTFALSLPILVGASLISGVHLGISILLLPVLVLVLFFMTYGIVLILAISYVRLRDLRHIIGIIMQLWFFGTPVVFNESMVPLKYNWILHLNPLGAVFVSFHHIFVYGTWPGFALLLEMLIWLVAVLGAALLIQKYATYELVEQM